MFLITFDNGTDTYSNKTPDDFNFTTNYEQLFNNTTGFATFAFVNKVHLNFSTWHVGAPDHTPNEDNGYMLFFDVGNKSDQLFNYKISNLTVDECYEFSAYFANIVKGSTQYTKPNIRFEVRSFNQTGSLIASNCTGDIPQCDNMAWSKHSVSFKAIHGSAVLLMISNTDWGNGNDVVIDDIELRVCPVGYPGCHNPGQYILYCLHLI